MLFDTCVILTLETTLPPGANWKLISIFKLIMTRWRPPFSHPEVFLEAPFKKPALFSSKRKNLLEYSKMSVQRKVRLCLRRSSSIVSCAENLN